SRRRAARDAAGRRPARNAGRGVRRDRRRRARGALAAPRRRGGEERGEGLSRPPRLEPRARTAARAALSCRGNPMKIRTLLFGLDGVTFDVVDPLLAAGKMPVLAGLIAR